MNAEERRVVYDNFLQVEAYSLKGIEQPFPMHFHEYYVVGLIESGGRRLSCGGKEYSAGAGDVLLFNPGDRHACEASGAEFLHYSAMNIGAEVMGRISGEIFGTSSLPKFGSCVVREREVFC